MKYINQLREGDNISEVYFCKTKVVAKTKAGKSYYSLTLQDKTGTLDGKVWDLSNGIDHFEPMDYIVVDGQVTVFNEVLQLNIRRIRRAREGEYVESDFLPCSPNDPAEMWQDLMAIVTSVKNPSLHQLLQSYFVEDAKFIQTFKKHSAAKSIHHGFVGGLLHHSLAVAKLCDFMSFQYKILNRDLLVTAALLHDIGKVDEISDFPQNDYTDEGQLLGHIVMGAMMLKERIRTIPNFPKKLEDELLHCILAHHGELEYGSPKKPAIIEAVALSFADNMDAKLETFTEILQQSEAQGQSGWLGFNRLFDSNVKRTE